VTNDDDDVEPSELEEYRICLSCIGDGYLKAEVERGGDTDACSYCGKTAKTMAIGDLADRVDSALDQHFYRTSGEAEGVEYLALKEGGYWERHGQPATSVIGEAAMIEEEPADHVRRVLEERHSDFEAAAAGEENPFDEEAHYEEKSVQDYELQEAWLHFQESLRAESRFFNPIARSTLDSIFDNLAEHRTHDGKSSIVDAGPGREIDGLYRARVFQSREKLEAAIKRPDIELGPPPPRLATAGRMNARGIGVFYGATDADVAFAETRPPVGSKVAVARFEIVRPLRLLDIEVLRSLYVEGSIFDSDYIRRLEKAKFLRTVSHRISRPVMPDDEPFEYLVTQAISDYLAAQRDPALNGIIYPSVQDGGPRRNVVLFHKASRVEPLDILPGTEISAWLETHDEDGAYPDYHVREEAPQTKPTAEEDADDGFSISAFLGSTAEPDNRGDSRELTLRLDSKSVNVHHVESVAYAKEVFPVDRHRSVKREEHEEKF
jgi:hypothetical protein